MSKPFDLQAALRGDAVTTRDGNKVIELHRMTSHAENQMGVIVVYEDKTIQRYCDDGHWLRGMRNHPRDLVMAPKVKYTLLWQRPDGFLYLGSTHDTREKAEQVAASNGQGNPAKLHSIVEVTV